MQMAKAVLPNSTNRRHQPLTPLWSTLPAGAMPVATSLTCIIRPRRRSHWRSWNRLPACLPLKATSAVDHQSCAPPRARNMPGHGWIGWKALTRYITEGWLEISNNTAERAMKPPVLGRRTTCFVAPMLGASEPLAQFSGERGDWRRARWANRRFESGIGQSVGIDMSQDTLNVHLPPR